MSFMINPNKNIFTLFILLVTAFSAFVTVNGQKRDNLTDQEDMNVRDAQELDARMQVFVKVIDRRLMALSDPNAGKSKQAQKDLNNWGELRTGAPADLFFDIQKTLDESINKIDDAAAREQKNPLFSKAVHVLANGCQRFVPQFKTFLDKAAEPREKVLIAQSIDNCNMIIEASARVPKEEKKKKN
jgi:hypothetical protein